MNIFTISLFTLINLIVLDMLFGFLQKHTRENNFTKSPNLLALLILSLTQQNLYLIDKKASLLRFGLGVFTSAALICACFYITNNTRILSLTLLPLIIMPFYYLIYGLMGHNLLAIGASIKNFRLRIMLALVIGSNIIIINISDDANMLVKIIYFVFAILTLSHVFFFSSLSRSKPGFYNLNQEDHDVIQASFMNYLVSILEFFYYALLLYFTFQSVFDISLVPMPVFLLGLYLLALILAQLLLVSRALVRIDLYQDYLLPVSFLFFGMSYIYKIYF